ncbi:acetyl-hydrolase [Pyrenophora tritici-repentis Pt-1C-BFP]|uniref:Acetyl-hydrolase n=2 Tax=Pyrenophora tritici-repentis TaxID=45151 RepID=A0A922SSF2_9PLEO|nr:acetyl-hydrolase [Pyrenophora tritici-repentis Pt-1C-BFP]EDU49721.1 acetyl-hydrolase [Pyrenophora tritici-repentis Pt-1C-BFP]KAI1509684.1 Acetyl-hydrolase [Pyrenophora tritici-repentis]PZC93667.1 acetyl-hydrolase [Pyrenophora tritici-repentis]
MPVNTISVGAAVTPVVIQTWLSHYLNRRPLAQKPTAHISYHEGLELIRRFLNYASFHTVDELQAFTSQWVPVPRWVHVEVVEISSSLLQRSAQHITAQLGPEGVKAVGGTNWWQWRREESTLKAEWIEMRKDFEARKQLAIHKGDRIMLYVHGGAYFFGSVDEHRYQMQRHARKLKARVLAPKYRLAPQFPFPCGLQDCLAAYLYLLEQKHDPATIILAGDSAGGGMVLSILVTMRDQGIPLPAGAILISPWVDLTHSFPSLGGDDKMDYIPSHGFIHKPSMSWPPPNADDLLGIETHSKTQVASDTPDKKEDHAAEKEAKEQRVQGYSVQSGEQPDTDHVQDPSATGQDTGVWISPNGKYSIGPKSQLSVQLEDARVEIKDQIQMYVSNHLLTHPLVSPALQPTLGGLPPLLIQTGGGELLRDEQIYVAHKAAQPLAYLPPPSNNQTAEAIQAQAAKYKPTNVQLQVWDDLCHVCPTLSFTRPAKHMYRSIAQFGAWALARAQKKSIDILDDDDISVMSTGSSSSSESDKESSSSSDGPKSPSAQPAPKPSPAKPKKKAKVDARVGRAGDPIPAFEHYMIRQRIDRHGRIYPLVAKEDLVALNLPNEDIGVPKPGPVGKWMKAQAEWNKKFSKQKIKIQKQRIKDMQKGFEGFDGETPPPTALAGRRLKGMKTKKTKEKKSWGMSMWSGWGSSHDQATIVREKKADQTGEEPSVTVQEPATPAANVAAQVKPKRSRGIGFISPSMRTRSRSRSRHSTITDRGQTLESQDPMPTTDLSKIAAPESGLADATTLAPERSASAVSLSLDSRDDEGLHITVIPSDNPALPSTLIPATDTLTTRPTAGGIAYPFSLKVDGPDGRDVNASTVTLTSVNMATPPAVDDQQIEMIPENTVEESVNEQVLKEERPGIERFFTAAPVSEFVVEQEEAKAEEVDKVVERPHAERFETAQEDLSTLAAAGSSSKA